MCYLDLLTIVIDDMFEVALRRTHLLSCGDDLGGGARSMDFIASADEGDDPGRQRASGSSGPFDGRDLLLDAFAQGDAAEWLRPNAWFGMVVSDLSGADGSCPGASDGEVFGLLSAWAAQDAWGSARKLAVLRELIRRHPKPGCQVGEPGRPAQWDEGLANEVALQLGISVVGAQKVLILAWDLEARIPGIGRALATGRLDIGRVRMLHDELAVLTDPGHVAEAEAMILAGLARCRTWANLRRLVQRAVCTVDPDGARKRRETAERENARVKFWRDCSGACAMAAYGLPTDEALAANAQVEARAKEYRASGVKRPVDILRVMAFLDLLNLVPAADRIARVKAEDAVNAESAANTRDPAASDDAAGAGEPATGRDGGRAQPRPSGDHAPGRDDDGVPAEGRPAGDGPGDGDPDETAPAGPSPDDASGDPGVRPDLSHPSPGPDLSASSPALPARVNLTLPLATQLWLAERPGEAWGLGALDPALVRQLAEAAARSPHSQFCVTITDEQGHAIGHGCCKPARGTRQGTARGTRNGKAPPGPDPPRSRAAATFTPSGKPGPPGGYGSWILTLPGAAARFTVDLYPIPVGECDHRYESPGHDPSDRLRHLIQVRDGACTFPSCSRLAHECDFEHAVPHEEGGRTCACNCHACSRSCHQLKQRPGWSVTQTAPGWHQWTTPSGRAYRQGPWQYPA
jgi:hypothetical protein